MKLQHQHEHDFRICLAALLQSKAKRRALVCLVKLRQEIHRLGRGQTEKFVLHKKIAWWHDAIHALPTAANHPLLEDYRQYVLPITESTKPLEALLDAALMDVDISYYPTQKELELYIRRTQKSFYQLLCQCLGYSDEEYEQYLQQLAYFVSNVFFLRDITKDAGLHRVYLPEQTSEKFGVSRREILLQSNPEKMTILIQQQISAARQYQLAANAALRENDLKPIRMFQGLDKLASNLLNTLSEEIDSLTSHYIQLPVWALFFLKSNTA